MSVSTVPEGGAYTILTDSACDIPAAALAEWGVPCCSQTFVWDGSPRQYTNDETPLKTFYARMRKGGVAKTSAINGAVLKAAFERELANGRDVLYLALSGGLSATYNAGRIAAEELREAYPAGKVLVVDSLSASAGFGLLLYLTVQRKKAGASLEEAAAFAEDLRMRLCHWFTVDDLTYLKRGGRVSSTAAFVAGVLHIKPVLHMDNEGHLVNMGQGQRQARRRQGAGGQIRRSCSRSRRRYRVYLPRRLPGGCGNPQTDAGGAVRRVGCAHRGHRPGDRRSLRPGNAGAVLRGNGAVAGGLRAAIILLKE